MTNYPNLRALVEGRVSGQAVEWMALCEETKAALAELARPNASNEVADNAMHNAFAYRLGPDEWERARDEYLSELEAAGGELPDRPKPAVSVDRQTLGERLANYFDIGDSYCYHLTGVKEGFAVGTVSIEDFEEFDEHTVADIVENVFGPPHKTAERKTDEHDR